MDHTSVHPYWIWNIFWGQELLSIIMRSWRLKKRIATFEFWKISQQLSYVETMLNNESPFWLLQGFWWFVHIFHAQNTIIFHIQYECMDEWSTHPWMYIFWMYAYVFLYIGVCTDLWMYNYNILKMLCLGFSSSEIPLWSV